MKADMNRYLVMLIRNKQFDQTIVPMHQQFLEDLRAQGRNEMAGPFGDQTGGAYLLRAQSMTEALKIAYQDPAYTSGGWTVTLYEWHAR